MTSATIIGPAAIIGSGLAAMPAMPVSTVPGPAEGLGAEEHPGDVDQEEGQQAEADSVARPGREAREAPRSQRSTDR